jgi:hypothetical protein
LDDLPVNSDADEELEDLPLDEDGTEQPESPEKSPEKATLGSPKLSSVKSDEIREMMKTDEESKVPQLHEFIGEEIPALQMMEG